MTEEEKREGNKIIQAWMGWKLESEISSIDNEPIYYYRKYDTAGNRIEENDGGESWSWNENSTMPYDWNWNLLMEVVDKIHNLEEDYSVVKNNFHVMIMKRETRIIYNYDDYHVDPDKLDNKRFKLFQDSFKSYRHVVFDNDPRYSTWTALVDFIKWFTFQPENKANEK